MKLHRKFLLSSICRNSLQHRCICNGLCAVFRRWLQANRRDRKTDRQRKPGRDRNIPQHATNRKLWLGTVLSCLHCIVPLILIRRLQWRHLPACYQDKQWRQTWRYCKHSLLKVTVPSHITGGNGQLKIQGKVYCMFYDLLLDHRNKNHTWKDS